MGALAGLAIIVGVIYIVIRVMGEALERPIHPDTDHDWAARDSWKVTTGQISKREYTKRLENGYYTKKK